MVNDVAKRLQFDSMDITGEATAGMMAPAAADHKRCWCMLAATCRAAVP
jgi:hypothetical protein